METLDLNCEKRELGTKGKVRSLRRVGKVPGVVYGPKTAAMPIAGGAEPEGFGHRRRQPAAAQAAGGGVRPQRPPCGYQGRAARLSPGNSSTPICTKINQPQNPGRRPAALSWQGQRDGGRRYPARLRACPSTWNASPPYPEAIDVDVTKLGIRDAVHILGIASRPDVSPVFDSDYALVTVLPPTVEAAPVAAEAAPEEGAAAAPAEGAEGAPAAEAAGAAEKKSPRLERSSIEGQKGRHA